MTRRNAESIMGLRVLEDVMAAGKTKTFVAADGHIEVSRASGIGASRALQSLVSKVYSIRAAQTRREQGHRCFCCNRLVPLETDHCVPRAHSRSDRRENLRSVCPDCHQSRHLHGVELKPHPEVLKSVARHGWAWGGNGWLRIGGSNANESNLGRRPVQV